MDKSKTSLSRTLARLTILPIILLSVVLTIFEIIHISASMAAEVENELHNLAESTVNAFDAMYPGDYQKYESSDSILITKGEDHILNQDYAFIDSLKERTSVDFTIFYDDMRIITIICDSKGNRLIGTQANAQIVFDVINSNSSMFYSNVDISGNKYYCYYAPLSNSDGNVTGMIGVVTPAARIYILILKATLPCILVSIIVIIITFFWSRKHSNTVISIIDALSNALGETAKGNLSNNVPPSLLSRKDEFGEMAHSVVEMQASLRTLVEQDMLTGLSNRRYGQERLDKTFQKSIENRTQFSLALGDIDFFKKFNDTYGHDCGDAVLKEVSYLIQDHLKDHGICVRWGGEEFLIIFTQGTYETHKQLMEQLLRKIESHTVSYIEKSLHVTMTFGLIDVFGYKDSDEAVKRVDELLYLGKEGGRNRLVTDADVMS